MLVFCWNCGAPQITLSEELLAQYEQQMQDASGDRTPDPSQSLNPSAVNWKAVIGIAAMVAGALSAISVLLPPLELLAWMAPSAVLALYTSRHRQTRVSAGVGARIGLLCGVLTSLGMTIITALQMLVLRYGLHGMAEVEANMNTVLLQAKERAMVQSGQAVADFFNLFLTVPEFRAGFFLTGLATVAGMLLVLSTAGGAFSGYIRSRQNKGL